MSHKLSRIVVTAFFAILLNGGCSSGGGSGGGSGSGGGGTAQENRSQSLSAALTCAALKPEECKQLSDDAQYTKAIGVALLAAGHTDKACYFADTNSSCAVADKSLSDFTDCKEIPVEGFCPGPRFGATLNTPLIVGTGSSKMVCAPVREYDELSPFSATNHPCMSVTKTAAPTGQVCAANDIGDAAKNAVTKICSGFVENASGTQQQGKSAAGCASVQLHGRSFSPISVRVGSQSLCVKPAGGDECTINPEWADGFNVLNQRYCKLLNDLLGDANAGTLSIGYAASGAGRCGTEKKALVSYDALGGSGVSAGPTNLTVDLDPAICKLAAP